MTRSMMESPNSSITNAHFASGLGFETDVTNKFSPTADFLLLVTKYRACSDDRCCVLGAVSVCVNTEPMSSSQTSLLETPS